MSNDLEFLNDLKNTLNNAPSNGNAEPRFFVIRDYEELVGDPAYHDVLNPHVILPSCGDSKPLKDHLQNIQSEDYAEIQYDYDYTDNTMVKLKEDFSAIDDDDSALEFIQAWEDEDADLVYTFEHPYIVPDTFFLSEQEAEDYLKRYRYNHSSKAHVYGMTGYRSFDYERLLDIIKTTDWDTLSQCQEDINNGYEPRN